MTPTGLVVFSKQERGADVVPLPLAEQVREYIRASKAENTLQGYRSDWRHFLAWCQGHDLCPCPHCLKQSHPTSQSVQPVSRSVAFNDG